MLEYSSLGLWQGDALRGEPLEFASAAHSLRRHKRRPEYLAQLQRAIQEARAEELRASSPTARVKARLRLREVRQELSYLASGGIPDAFSGYISLRTL